MHAQPRHLNVSATCSSSHWTERQEPLGAGEVGEAVSVHPSRPTVERRFVRCTVTGFRFCHVDDVTPAGLGVLAFSPIGTTEPRYRGPERARYRLRGRSGGTTAMVDQQRELEPIDQVVARYALGSRF